jgi:hypothetical protein
MSHSTAAGHLPHSVLEHNYGETTTSASDLQALRAALLEQFPANYFTIEQSACQVADWDLAVDCVSAVCQQTQKMTTELYT